MKLPASWILLVYVILTSCTNGGDPERILRKAEKIHLKVLTIDTHTDTPLRFLRPGFNLGQRNDPRARGGRVDFPRLKEGGLDAVFFAVFLNQGERDSVTLSRIRSEADSIFSLLKATVGAHTDMAGFAYTARDASRLEAGGKRAVYIGLENGYPLGTDLDLAKKYYDLGTRYITLCHSRNNDICDSSTDDEGPEHNGLSAFGKDLVREMNRLGMLVDVSHISDQSFYDVLEVSHCPVIASHSCSRAICNNPRNLDDDMLKALADHGGVIQVCLVSSYLRDIKPNPERDSAFAALRLKYGNFRDLTEDQARSVRLEWDEIDNRYPQELACVRDVVDHIDHVVRIAGIDHVGIGSDFDGGGGVEGCYDVSEMGNITLELVRRGYGARDIRKIWGGNFMRVFRQTESYAKKI